MVFRVQYSPFHHRQAVRDLETLGDVVRYGASAFAASGLDFGHGTANALDEAAFIALEILHLPIDGLSYYQDARLTRAERRAVIGVYHRRIVTRKPAAYLLNRAYIQGMPFYVDDRVIVPRSYIAEILCRPDENNPVAAMGPVESVLDLCTGSGCLAIMAAYLFPQAHIDAVDLSADALDVARRNANDHDMTGDLTGRISWIRGDLFEGVGSNKYDLILTNPPYVSAAEMDILSPEYAHEPRMALAGGEDGMDLVRRILDAAPAHLNPGGGMMCEIGLGRDVIMRDYPQLPLRWLKSAESDGEVFWMAQNGKV